MNYYPSESPVFRNTRIPYLVSLKAWNHKEMTNDDIFFDFLTEIVKFYLGEPIFGIQLSQPNGGDVETSLYLHKLSLVRR